MAVVRVMALVGKAAGGGLVRHLETRARPLLEVKGTVAAAVMVEVGCDAVAAVEESRESAAAAMASTVDPSTRPPLTHPKLDRALPARLDAAERAVQACVLGN